MKKCFLLLALIIFPFLNPPLGKPNCNVYKYQGDNTCFRGCEKAMTAIKFSQGSKASQLFFDEAISICPTLDYAYMEKAVPYLKRGQFIRWKVLIDRAVELNPTQHLGYRGWCRYQFLRDYKGAIRDIEKLDEMVDYDIGYSQNGHYHLKIALGLFYKGLGQLDKAISLMEGQLATENYMPGLYDYLHLGVLYLEIGAMEKAKSAFEQQLEINEPLAETYFYLGKWNLIQGNRELAQTYFQTAKNKYQQEQSLIDYYVEPMDKIYLKDIEEALLDFQ